MKPIFIKIYNILCNIIYIQFTVSCKITEMEKCEGEAVANNRKGKLIFFYEWNIVLKWQLNGTSNDTIEGKVNIPNLSEENDINEIDVSINFSPSVSPFPCHILFFQYILIFFQLNI